MPADIPHIRSKDGLLFNESSEEIIDALGLIGKDYERPRKFSDKRSLSFSDPVTRKYPSRSIVSPIQRNLSPKDLVIRYLREVLPLIDSAPLSLERDESDELDASSQKKLLDVFGGINGKWLKARGWDETHVMTWAWLLLGESAERSAFRLHHTICRESQDALATKVPQFVILLLAKRTSMTARGLQSLLGSVHTYMDSLQYRTPKLLAHGRVRSSFIPHPKDDQIGMYEFMFMMLVVRLVRTARAVLPAALIEIAGMFCQYMNGRNFHQNPKCTPEGHLLYRRAETTYLYNTVLKLIAVPIGLRPVEAAMYQRQAQRILLERMNRFEPPLVIDRKGIRAITATQLLKPKTEEEQKWAELKSSSWPPWKEDKLGIDADIGPEYGISQAKETLHYSKAAGYASGQWEDTASILSGWDVDNSPTIQTRVYQPDVTRAFAEDDSDKTLSILTVARMNATRTLNEAWAAFLLWKDQRLSKVGSTRVYHAMLRKLHQASQSQARPHDIWAGNGEDVATLPGDELEIHPEPHEQKAIYVQRLPPSFLDFLREMVEDGVKFNDDMLCLLMQNAKTSDELKLAFATAQLSLRDTLADIGVPELANQGRGTVVTSTSTSSRVLQILLQSLARIGSSWSEDPRRNSSEQNSNATFNINFLQASIKGALDNHIRDRRTWEIIIYSLAEAQSRICLDSKVRLWSSAYVFSDKLIGIINWKTAAEIVQRMNHRDVPMDLWIFRSLCMCFRTALIHSARIISIHGGMQYIPMSYRASVGDVLNNGPKFLTQVFRSLVLPVQNLASPTRYMGSHTLLEIPTGRQLYPFIRVLGLARDYSGLRDLVNFMHKHKSALCSAAEEFSWGKPLLRKCLVAIRVYTERSWYGRDLFMQELLWLDNPKGEQYTRSKNLRPSQALHRQETAEAVKTVPISRAEETRASGQSNSKHPMDWILEPKETWSNEAQLASQELEKELYEDDHGDIGDENLDQNAEKQPEEDMEGWVNESKRRRYSEDAGDDEVGFENFLGGDRKDSVPRNEPDVNAEDHLSHMRLGAEADEKEESSDSVGPEAPEEIRMEIFELVSDMKELGGWPSDELVERYLWKVNYLRHDSNRR